ncbi:MAG: phosphotransacetylase family protein [Alphaproteobacteria bacterium]
MKTNRIFIAATHQDVGKTTTSLGFLSHLQKSCPNVGFMKPVGQRFVTLEDGTNVDKDVWLLREAFNLNDSAELMSPVIIPSGFTKNYIDNRDSEKLKNKIISAFKTLSENKDFVLIEGTGHAGVGSVIDASNAQVAKILDSDVILVAGGGIGKPIDEIVLNNALFQQHGVKVAGVILNKVLPEKIEQIKDYAERALAWHGLDLIGVLPKIPLLSEPTLREVLKKVKGKFISGKEFENNLFSDSVLVSHFYSDLPDKLSPKTLVIASGEQTELLIACMGMEKNMEQLRQLISGILLVDGFKPKTHILKALEKENIPVILTEMPAFSATRAVSNLVAKIQPDNPEKISEVSRIFEENIQWEKLKLT